MKKNRRRYKKKRIAVACLLLFVVSFLLFLGVGYVKKNVFDNKHVSLKSGENEEKKELENAKNQYSEFVKTLDNVKVYTKDEKGYQEAFIVHGDVEFKLDSEYEIVDKYYKIIDSDYYIAYNDTSKIESLSVLSGEYKNYSNYVAFNLKLKLKDGAKLYVNDNSYYEVNGGEYLVIIKDDGRYGIEFNHSLVYVNSDDVEDVIEIDDSGDYAVSVAVLNYHYTVSSENENGELDECKQDICITDTMFDKHVSYLKENYFYGANIRDLELFIDGKVRLPSKSVLITIDDGWYVPRSISILEKYQMLGTLFLIGSLAGPDAYKSDYLEIHSHTWDMHKLGQCPSSVGRGGILCLDEDVILEDLKRSRESLNNTTYFCYPFYDYNARAIRLLKEAGFTMAFAGGEKSVRVGQDKFKIPRYIIVNYTTMSEFISYVS